MKVNYKRLAIFIFVPLILGALVGFLTAFDSKMDSVIPAWIFPVIWTILYVLMGVSSYIIYEQDKEISRIYIIQLIFNLLWSFIFFKFKLFVFAFIWILILIILVILMIKDFSSRNRIAGLLQIPYLVWLFVALFLNLTFII